MECWRKVSVQVDCLHAHVEKPFDSSARAGLVRARTALVNTARSLAKSYGERLRGCDVRNMNPEKAEAPSPELERALEPLLSAIEEPSQRISEYNEHRSFGRRRELSEGQVAEADQGSGHADHADVSADAGRSASLSQEP
jgi:hypothetical protein